MGLKRSKDMSKFQYIYIYIWRTVFTRGTPNSQDSSKLPSVQNRGLGETTTQPPSFQPSDCVERNVPNAKLHKANGIDQCCIVIGVGIIDMQSHHWSVSDNVNHSLLILPLWIAIITDTPGRVLEAVVHKDLHKAIRLISCQRLFQGKQLVLDAGDCKHTIECN